MAEVTFRAPVRPSGRAGGGHLVDVRPETRARRVERTIQALIERASGG